MRKKVTPYFIKRKGGFLFARLKGSSVSTSNRIDTPNEEVKKLGVIETKKRS